MGGLPWSFIRLGKVNWEFQEELLWRRISGGAVLPSKSSPGDSRENFSEVKFIFGNPQKICVQGERCSDNAGLVGDLKMELLLPGKSQLEI